ncbi:hypothetical protein [Streptomyces solaniscabiei]|uniref:hypothetical protein n=1 Tax=Streptomyces solaniscabiei TaxID=2683255 RepID=UPI001CE23C71|nr:hypothetical protein [Streptomyces solaniscabiei]
MSEPSGPLPETLARLRALIAERHLDEGAVLNVAELSHRALLREVEVEALLAGLQLSDSGSPEEVIKGRVRERLPRLFNAYLKSGKIKPADGYRTIHAQLECSEVWARQLLTGRKVPSVGHLSVLAEFFNVDERFFTGAPADNLNRALQPKLQDLQVNDPVAELMTEYGLEGVSFRRRVEGMAPERKAMLAGVIKAVLEAEQ